MEMTIGTSMAPTDPPIWKELSANLRIWCRSEVEPRRSAIDGATRGKFEKDHFLQLWTDLRIVQGATENTATSQLERFIVAGPVVKHPDSSIVASLTARHRDFLRLL